MEKSMINLEYCARYAIKHASGDESLAQHIAESKYKALVGRSPFSDEIRGIQHLIAEISEWSAAKAYVISTTA